MGDEKSDNRKTTIAWLDEMHVKYGDDYVPSKSVPVTLEETNAMLAAVLRR